jgi:hypothetical protein
MMNSLYFKMELIINVRVSNIAQILIVAHV